MPRGTCLSLIFAKKNLRFHRMVLLSSCGGHTGDLSSRMRGQDGQISRSLRTEQEKGELMDGKEGMQRHDEL